MYIFLVVVHSRGNLVFLQTFAFAYLRYHLLPALLTNAWRPCRAIKRIVPNTSLNINIRTAYLYLSLFYFLWNPNPFSRLRGILDLFLGIHVYFLLLSNFENIVKNNIVYNIAYKISLDLIIQIISVVYNKCWHLITVWPTGQPILPVLSQAG